jgi:hypothetical protein
MNCPGCNNAFSEMTLDARFGDDVRVQTCTTCQSFWFALYKDLQLSAASTLKLMKFIGEHPPSGVIQLAQDLRCPVCATRLLLTNDQQRATKFAYWRCGQEHGKFIGFVDFLREKDYIHPLTPQQVEQLRQNVQTVSCSHCGAPIDLNQTSVCACCGSPLSLLDMQHPQLLLEELKDKAAHPVDMAKLAAAVTLLPHDSDASFAKLRSQPDWLGDVAANGLVHACLSAVARWME